MTHESGSKSTFAAFKENLTAYTFDLGGLIAGFAVASQLGVFNLSPWAIAIYPGLLGIKGIIHSLLRGRLGTALHLGTVYPRFSGNTKSFYKLVSVTIVLTLTSSIFMGLISMVFGVVLWGTTFADASSILFVIIATMSLGLLMSFLTVEVAFVTFKRGLDPDIVVYPIMSTVSDIFITLCYIVVLNMFFVFNSSGTYTLAVIIIVHSILAGYLIVKNVGERDFRKNLKESLLTLLFVSVIVNITGTVLKNINSVVANRKEIYTVYPAIIDMTGDLGLVIGSTATTRLALGLLRPTASSIRHHSKTIISAWIASIVMFVVLAFLSPLVNGVFSFAVFSNLVTVLLTANLLAVAATILLSYGISILTFQKGLNPDNFTVPIETSFADTLMSIALLAALILVG